MNIIPSYCNENTCDLTIGYTYNWICKINGKMYIGSHQGTKPNYIGSGIAFLRAVKKYGIENFKRIILYVGPDFREIEDEILKAIDCEHSVNFYNSTNETTSPMLGKHHTDETKQKISNAFAGENHWNFGKHLAEETKQKIAKAHLGKPLSEEHKRKISETHPRLGHNLGKHLTEEHKQKISDGCKGKPAWNKGVPAHNKGISPKKEHYIKSVHNRWHKSKIDPDCPLCNKSDIINT